MTQKAGHGVDGYRMERPSRTIATAVSAMIARGRTRCMHSQEGTLKTEINPTGTIRTASERGWVRLTRVSATGDPVDRRSVFHRDLDMFHVN